MSSSSKKPRQVGSEFNSTQQMLVQDARKTKKKQEKLQSQISKATTLDTVNNANGATKFTTGYTQNYPTSALTMGKWIAKDPRDTRMKNLNDLQSKSAFKNIPVPTEEILSWVEDKQNQVYQQNLLKLGTALIDPNNPETQERAYAIMPSLQKVPESHLKDEVAMQMSLNSILRDGVLRGPEDLQFIFHILDPNVILPLEPLWDLSGAFKEHREAVKRNAVLDRPSGIFSPFKYGSTNSEFDSAFSQAQFPIKVAIVKRLFPAFRNKTYDEIRAFITDISTRKIENLPEEIGYVSDRMRGKFDPYGKMLDENF